MNEIKTADHFEGKGCACYATSANECGCEEADWTPVEVYKLREDAKQLASRLTALELHSTSELARLEQERDEAIEATQKAKAYKRVLKVTNAQLKRERDDALSQIAQAECRAERFCQERDEARNAIVGWENKWKCAIDMAARAELERDELKYSLKIREINEYLKYSKDRNEIDDIMSKLNFKL